MSMEDALAVAVGCLMVPMLWSLYRALRVEGRRNGR